MLDPQSLKAMEFEPIIQDFTEKDCMFYALSLGIGQQPTDPWELQFVQERGLRTLPTLSVVLAHPGFWQQDAKTGINWKGIVHGEQRLTVHKPLPTRGRVRGTLKVDEVIDKGEGRGALLYNSRRLYDDTNDELLCTLQSLAFCRFDGGFSKGATPAEPPVPPLEPVPGREPDFSYAFRIPPSAALLYRLNADLNPLHSDPEIARAAGFPRPILHGLCTYGIAAYSVMTLTRDVRAGIRRFDVRFTAPVYPGETVVTELWLEGETAGRFRCRCVERDSVVLDRGHVEWFNTL